MRSAHVYSVIGRSAIRPVLAAAGCLVAALALAPSAALAQLMCVEVNGEMITDYDIEERTKLDWLANHKSLPRKEIIDELIDDKLKVQIARRGGADVGYVYTLRPILFVVPSGSAPLLDARRKDADTLRTRFANCEAGLMDARAQQNVIIRPPVTVSSSDLAPAPREILNKTEIGHLTPPETTPRGIELFALCDKKKSSEAEYLRARRRRSTINFMPGCLLLLR